MIQDSEYPPDQTAHYSPGNYIGHSRGVYYNAASDMTNPRGAGTTYFHELAHMIDHARATIGAIYPILQNLLRHWLRTDKES